MARNCCLFVAWQSARALPYSEPKIGSAAFEILRRADPRLPCGNVIRMAGMKSLCCGELVQSRNHFDSALIHWQSPSTEQGHLAPLQRLAKKPGAPLGFIDPVLEQAGSSEIPFSYFHQIAESPDCGDCGSTSTL